VKEYQKITLLPKDSNSHGTIFGGVIMSYIDLAAAACCHDHFCNEKFVTVVVRELTFRQPVHVGDLLTLSGEVVRQGTTSVTVHIAAEVQRHKGHDRVRVTDAELVFVAVDDAGRKAPLRAWD
jgi:acyl-CoA thioesterase YciA